MSPPIQAVFFDADGVLVDSLSEHLSFCESISTKYDLGSSIPTVQRFRALVQNGAQVSPMSAFFRTIGFPEDAIQRAVFDYEANFRSNYRPRQFEGVANLLTTLHDTGLVLGIVTSNTRENIAATLQDLIGLFDRHSAFYLDSDPAPPSKSWCLIEGANGLNLKPEECLYVGDQPADAAAALSAGTRFMGVAYGWGYSRGDGNNWPNNVRELLDRILLLRSTNLKRRIA